jgi:hypothetical protein
VKTKGGEILTVRFALSRDKVKDVYLEGGAEIVFEGKLNDDAIYGTALCD